MVRRLPRRSRVDTGDNLSILWMEHRWSSDGSKDNPTRLNPPPSPEIMPLFPTHVPFYLVPCRPCPCLRENILRQACTDYETSNEARYRRYPTLSVTFRRAGAALDECRTGSWSARKARASSNPEQPTHSCFSHVLPRFVWRRRCFDVVVLQIDERDNRCEAKKLAKETLKLRQLDSQSVRNFFPIPFDFFFFFSSLHLEFELKVSKIETFETWKRGSWKFDLWWDGSFRVFFFFWKFFWKENFWNIERISFLGKVFLENLKSWIEKWWI